MSRVAMSMSHRGRERSRKRIDSGVSATSWAREPKRALVNLVMRALIWPAAEHVPEACCCAHRVYSGQRRVADGPVHCASSCPIFRQRIANPHTPALYSL